MLLIRLWSCWITSCKIVDLGVELLIQVLRNFRSSSPPPLIVCVT